MNFDVQLKSETVAHAHPAEAIVVDLSTSVSSVLRLMKEEQVGSVLICEGECLVGIFTERDALRLMASAADLDVPIEQEMVSDPVTVSADETVGKAITQMSKGGYRRLPIVDESCCPVGILKVSGILRYLVEHFPEVIYTLPPEPHHRTQHREGA